MGTTTLAQARITMERASVTERPAWMATSMEEGLVSEATPSTRTPIVLHSTLARVALRAWAITTPASTPTQAALAVTPVSLALLVWADTPQASMMDKSWAEVLTLEATQLMVMRLASATITAQDWAVIRLTVSVCLTSRSL